MCFVAETAPAADASARAHWRRVEEVFHRALEIPPLERDAFVREQCHGDAALADDVRGILRGYEAQDRRSGSVSSAARFGAFETIREIGQGGMGVVYLARRVGDFEQQAAVKVISGSPAAAALLAERFRQERQILASLDHPNIARLLDGGVTNAGQPYLTMEYVEGERVDRYCEARNLTIPERLALFRKICAAVHFAHQHLVIHRDLKPGNILVNREGEPKLLDFGIAKILAGPGESPEHAQTITGAMFTPQYASPEQIRGLPCTIASDVYSLGVVLYTLLAGKAPYSDTASTPAELLAAVVTQEIPRPSSVAPVQVRAALRGDLDGIALKALARSPAERYGSVEQFSEDLYRHLTGRPVSALEAGRWYVARKFVRRHRVGVGAAALVVLSLMGGLAATLWQARIAERERALAEQRFSDARKLANYLLFPLYDSVQSLPGSLPVRAEMAAQSLQYLDRLEAAKSADFGLRLELAEGYLRLGTILEAPVGAGDSLGDTARALEADQKAVALLEPLARDNPKVPRVERDLSQGYALLGAVSNLRGKPDEGIADLKKAIGGLERLTASDPRDVDSLIEGGRAYLAFSDAASGRGGGFIDMATREQVMPAADKAIARFESALRISPGEDRALAGLAQAYNLKGNLIATKNVSEGLPVYQLGLDALQRLSGAARRTENNRALEARLLTMIAFCQEETGRFGEALATLAPAREILDRLGQADPANATNALRRVNLYRTRGIVNQYWGHTRDAADDYATAIGILDGMIAVDPAKQSSRLVRAELQGKLGQMLAKEGRASDAERVLEAALSFFAEVADRPDAAAQNLNEAASAYISSPIEPLNDYHRALGYARRADQLSNGKDVAALFYMAQCYEQLHDGPKALEAIKRDLALIPAPGPGEKPSRNRELAEKHLRLIQGMIGAPK